MRSKVNLSEFDKLIETVDSIKAELHKIAQELPSNEDLTKVASYNVEYLDSEQVLNFAKAFLGGR